MAAAVADLGEDAGEGHGGVFHRAAEDAGVQVARRTVDGDLKGHDAAQTVAERGLVGRGHAGVRDDEGFALQFRAVLAQEFGQVRAADLLLALDDEGEVAGQGGAGLEIGFDGLEVGEVLAFVISAAAGEEVAAFHAGFEGRGLPEFERLGRLDIVVAVHNVVGLAGAGGARGFGDDDGMAGGGAHLGGEADAAAMGGEPFGAGEQVFFVGRLRGDAGETEIFKQLREEAFPVGFKVIDNLVHDGILAERTGIKISFLGEAGIRPRENRLCQPVMQWPPARIQKKDVLASGVWGGRRQARGPGLDGGRGCGTFEA